MAWLIYSAITSLDGYIENEAGKFDLGRAGRRGVAQRLRFVPPP
jgi:hypothetical protein